MQGYKKLIYFCVWGLAIFTVVNFNLLYSESVSIRWEECGPVGGDKAAIMQTKNGMIFVSLPDGGGFWYTVDKHTWYRAEVYDKDGMIVPDAGLWDITEVGEYIYGGGSRGIYKSQDGREWERVIIDIPALDGYEYGETVFRVVKINEDNIAFSTYLNKHSKGRFCRSGFYLYSISGKRARFIPSPEEFSGKIVNCIDYNPSYGQEKEKEKVIVLSNGKEVFFYNMDTGSWMRLDLSPILHTGIKRGYVPPMRFKGEKGRESVFMRNNPRPKFPGQGKGLPGPRRMEQERIVEETYPTVVKFDQSRDILYVGLSNGCIGRYTDGKWDLVNPAEFVGRPFSCPIYSIEIDPYNPDVIYFGEGAHHAGPYHGPSGMGNDIHGAIFWQKDGQAIPVYIYRGGWGAGVIALKEGFVEKEPVSLIEFGMDKRGRKIGPEGFSTPPRGMNPAARRMPLPLPGERGVKGRIGDKGINIKRAAKVMFTWTAPNIVVSTEDGGFTWKSIRNGIFGETVNLLCRYVKDGKEFIGVPAVTANAIGHIEGGGIVWDYLFHSGIRTAGYTRTIIPVKKEWNVFTESGQKADLIIATGVPYPEGMQGHGLYAFRTEDIKKGKLDNGIYFLQTLPVSRHTPYLT